MTLSKRERRSVRVSLRLTPSMKALMDKLCEDDSLSQNDLVEALMEGYSNEK